MPSGIRHQASGIRHQASGIRHQASGIRHQASGIRHHCVNESFLEASCLLLRAKLKKNLNKLSIFVLGYIYFSCSYGIASNAETIFKDKKDAIVKIVTVYQGVQISHGTGFFISSDGQIVTNYHVVQGASVPGHAVSVHMANGKVINDLSAFSCGKIRGQDLCLLKTNERPRVWLKLKSTMPSIGSSIYVIGHPAGYDYTISNGIVSAIRSVPFYDYIEKKQLETKRIQITAPISSGNSGGPILDTQGEVVGVATWISTAQGQQNLNFGILSEEVLKFNQESKPISLKDIFKKQNDKMTRTAKTLTETYFPKNKNDLRGSLSKDFYTVSLKGPGHTTTTFPNSKLLFGVKDCAHVSPDANAAGFACKDPVFGGAVMIAAMSTKAIMNLKTELKSLIPQPIPYVKELMSVGKWEDTKKNLTPQQISFLFSQPKPVQCESLKTQQGTLPIGTEVCTQFIYNVAGPDTSSLTYLVIHPKSEISYMITGVAPNTSLALLYFTAAETAAYGLKTSASGKSQMSGDPTLPQKVFFNQRTFELKNNVASYEKSLAEYIPTGETFENFTALIAINFDRNVSSSLEQIAQATVQRINDRKNKGDVVANSMSFKSQNNNSILVDFVLSENDVIEHNLVRYFKIGNNVISYRISRRILNTSKKNPSELERFFSSIKNDRNKNTAYLMGKSLPLPKGAK